MTTSDRGCVLAGALGEADAKAGAEDDAGLGARDSGLGDGRNAVPDLISFVFRYANGAAIPSPAAAAMPLRKLRRDAFMSSHLVFGADH
jgi:hypothetical protein